MIIAVEGCAHGELDKIYDSVERLSRQRNVKVDLLICCGDFQAVRNEMDLQCMAVPDKFKDMCSFYKYYSGEVKAPILTIFVGGNHEASNYLQELAYGGWVAPNIYYLGYAGVVNIGGVRIAGMSGLFKSHDYHKGHFEFPPYSGATMRSAYHIRSLEVFRLKQVQGNIDVFVSHEWPRGIYNYGDTREVLHWKPFFRNEMANNTLGCQAGEILIHDLKPKHWFSAHLHCRFSATIQHNEHQATHFLALDKCLPKRQFLELVDIPHDPSKSLDLCYDPHWLAILKSTNNLLHIRPTTQYMPGPNSSSSERWNFHPTDEELQSVTEMFENDFRIPLNFTQTAKAFEPLPYRDYNRGAKQPKAQLNPQTTTFCEKLGVSDPLELLIGKPIIDSVPVTNPDEIDLEDDDDGNVAEGETKAPEKSEDGSNLFFLDTKPGQQRSKMSLPQPVTEVWDESEPVVNPADERTKVHSVHQVESMSSLTETSITDDAADQQPVVKKFKRRNQELYTDEPEEET